MRTVKKSPNNVLVTTFNYLFFPKFGHKLTTASPRSFAFNTLEFSLIMSIGANVIVFVKFVITLAL